MIPESIKFPDLARAVHMPVDRLWRLCQIAGQPETRPSSPESLVAPHDVLMAGLAKTITLAVPGADQEGPLGLFLKEIGPYLTELANKLEEVWEKNEPGSEVPSYYIGFAENMFVTWSDLDKFYHMQTSTYVEHLPTPAAWATTLHVAAIYFQVRNVLKEIEDAHRTGHVAEPPG